jgi:hypothetical protein
MGNVLAQPVRVPVDPLADLPGVVLKDTLGKWTAPGAGLTREHRNLPTTPCPTRRHEPWMPPP